MQEQTTLESLRSTLRGLSSTTGSTTPTLRNTLIGVLAAAAAIIIISRSGGKKSIKAKSKPKQTGYGTALLRTIMLYQSERRLHRDDIAPLMLPLYWRLALRLPFVRDMMIRKNSNGLFPVISARTLWFDHIMEEELKNGVQQIVILGAALDSRSLRYANQLTQNNIRVFELDLPPFIEERREKIKQLTSSNNIPNHVTLVPVDLSSQSLYNVLIKGGGGYDAKKKALFLWEGVTMYLEQSAVEAVLSFVEGYAAKGSVVAFDYVYDDFLTNPQKYYGGEALEASRNLDEPYLFGLDPPTVPEFARKNGLKVKEHYHDKDLMKWVGTSRYGPPFGFIGFVALQT